MWRSRFLCAATVFVLGAMSAQGQEAADIPAPKKNAARLAGLVGFVNQNCDKLRTDEDRFKGVIRSMGVDPEELDRGLLLLEARTYTAAYQKDVPASCQKAEELFGRNGRIIPGVFLAR